MRRRSAANASRERVKAFSFTKSCCRAVSHCCCDTTGGVFIFVLVDMGEFSFHLGSELISVAVFFLREIFTANAASPPVETGPATISPTVDKQNGHMVHLFETLSCVASALSIWVTGGVSRFLQARREKISPVF
jgi:hypothetical protein